MLYILYDSSISCLICFITFIINNILIIINNLKIFLVLICISAHFKPLYGHLHLRDKDVDNY